MHISTLISVVLPILGIASAAKDPKAIQQGSESTALTITPLHGSARTGLIDPVTEEGLIAAMGPRFANVFLANVTSDGQLGSCWGCVSTVLKESPCVYKAITNRDPAELLKCGIDKADLCKCADCLPSTLAKYVDQFCKTAHANEDLTVTDAKTSGYGYVEFAEAAAMDPSIQGFRGDLSKYSVSQVRSSFCPFSSCGSCDCCVGACVFGACIGGCA